MTGARSILALPAAIVFALSACSRGPAPPDPSSLTPTAFPQFASCRLASKDWRPKAEITALAEAVVRRIMRDPDSVKFTRPAVYARATCNEGEHDVVCGYVNAKNAYGGYVGENVYAFVATGKEFAVEFYPTHTPGPEDIPVLTHLRDATKYCGLAQDAGK
jgi:hypothetical protein